VQLPQQTNTTTISMPLLMELSYKLTWLTQITDCSPSGCR